ncbi:MAG: molybdopterin-synthase adenylyltransferase MoeB [Pseudomonadota bacterium]|nr:molybdopterin-synthase adenylyltransferase MoeB [Pseudomonadota bacterium]
MSIERISPAEALRRQAAGAVLVDVREPYEHASGYPASALRLAGAALHDAPRDALPQQDAPLVLICQAGGRSLQAAEALLAQGYTRVASVDGGFARWSAEGLPTSRPDPCEIGPDADFHERYSRHLRLPEVGEAGQRRLQAARVAIVGAGGLGSPAAFYLAAAGVGTLLLADDDVVDRSNLQRQILHTDARVGTSKVASARTALLALNPRAGVEAMEERITAANVEALLADADVVIDGSDNFPARYLLNDACVKLGKPLVYGAVHRFEGQVSVFDAGRRRGGAPCYRCLFPSPPSPEAAPNCSQSGVLGVLPGVIGVLQATEAIKLILGIGEPLTGRLLHFDALSLKFRETRLPADPDCSVCAPGRPFPGYVDYERFCAGS